MKNIVFLSGFIILFCSCEKENFARKGEGVLVNRCNWLIEIEEGSEGVRFLELTNIDAFDIDPEDVMSVSYKCKELENTGSACQMGRIVELKKLKEIE